MGYLLLKLSIHKYKVDLLHKNTLAMTLTDNETNYLNGLVALYHLLINADGHIDEKELKMGEVLKEHEKIDDWKFNYHLDRVTKLDKEEVLKECIESLRNCEYEQKIKCIAWMSLIANSDGFMDPEEWKLIYYIYNTELKLELQDILEMQKQLPRS